MVKHYALFAEKSHLYCLHTFKKTTKDGRDNIPHKYKMALKQILIAETKREILWLT